MRGAPEPNQLIPFEALRTIHYARFVVLEHERLTTGPLLVFSTNYDGPEGEDACTRSRALEHHIDELVQKAGDGLHQIFECCKGYEKQDELKRFLKNQKKASTFYVGAPGRSRDQIRWEAELRRDIERVLDEEAKALNGRPPEDVREAVRAKLNDKYPNVADFLPQPDLTVKVRSFQKALVGAAILVLSGAFYLGWKWMELPITQSPVDNFISVAAVCGIVVITLGAPIAALLAYFRYLEKTDPQFQPEFKEDTHGHFSRVSAGENEFLQNQLTSLTFVKPGILRWLLIRGVFFALQILATNQYNKGKLGDIPSIHFARWVLLPHRAVLFFSNFDNSWQSYLGDFIDQASSGLTAVWSNTERYPRTKWLVRSGSRDAARFLAWTRANQHPTQVWYSAYPGLSVVNINANTEIRRGFVKVKKEKEKEKENMDAATWLFHVRSVDRRAADDVFSDARAAEAPLRLDDIQGIILKGYAFKPEARYLMLRVRDGVDPAGVREFLSKIKLTSAEVGTRANYPRDPLCNVAFTYEGLKAIGLDSDICNAFSTPFVQGSHDQYRALVNGDVGENAPDRWRWGGTTETMPHVLLAVFGQNEDPAKDIKGIDAHADKLLAEARRAGLDLLVALDGTKNEDRKEHFGFRDGIGQPVVRGCGQIETAINTIEPGEILLGHADGYGNITHSPMSDSGFNFGFNGSYLVFRQLKQDVEAFWGYCKDVGGDVDKAITAAARMVGRWPSGAALVLHPGKDPDRPRFKDENEFTYLSNDANNDRYGARCPFGSHLRRSNPRDWQLASTREESLRLSNLHRIIRRGRPYGPPLVPSMKPREMIEAATNGGSGAAGPERGMQFICFNANIDRQFEFIQQQWCNNAKFAGLTSDADPLLGAGRPPKELGLEGQTFTPQTDIRKKLQPRFTGMQPFVSVVGSAYFFMPSIPVMKLLCGDALLAHTEDKLEKVPDDEQLYIKNIIDTQREKMKTDYAGQATLRDAHPKMHGCVKARFTVEPTLDTSLRHGIFGEGQPSSYEAFVRFSNASEKVQDDASPDIRGVAIKLRNVQGWKLLDGEEDSKHHDFLLISHDRFFVRDVQEFAGFIQAIATDTVPRYLLRHPIVARRMMKALGKHSSPLEITYFGVVPYLLGKQAVKYKLRPTRPDKTPIPSNPDPNYLREALWKRLASGPVSFDFLVQVRIAPKGNEKAMPIEDPTVVWSEKDSPFVKVATLEILPQTRDDTEISNLQRQAESWVFNPWQCLPAHRPLGGLNRARRQVYRALSSYRNTRNAAPEGAARSPSAETSREASQPETSHSNVVSPPRE
jgi:Dyp-type peroxidase family